jgi:hypothetical protein
MDLKKSNYIILRMPKLISNEPIPNIIENINALDKGRFIPDNSLDIIFCDPPSFKNPNDKQLNNWNSQKDYEQWIRIFINISSIKLKKTGIFYLIGDVEDLNPFIAILQEFNFILSNTYFFSKNKKLNAGRRIKETSKTIKVVDTIFVFTRDLQKKVKKLLKLKQEEHQKSAREINYALTGNANGGGYWSLYCGENSRNILPSEQHWDIFKDIFKIDINYNEIKPQFIEWNGYNLWDDIKYSDDKFLCGNNRPIQIYDRLINMNRIKSHELTCWDPFTGYGNCVNAMKHLGCKYYASEFDMKIYYKALINTGNNVSIHKPQILLS